MKKIALFILVLGLFGSTRAQDPHFSQYLAAPISLNPSNTGFFDADYRFAIIQRQQWFNAGSYSTTNITADMKIFKEHIPENDVLGVGITGLFDHTLGGGLQSNYFSGSVAYHKSLAYDGSQMLTVGTQVTFANVYVDYSKLTFASQFDGINFDTSIPVYTAYANSSSSYVDVHAGLLYAVHLSGFNFSAGAALFHIAKPRLTLFNSSDNIIPYRTTFHGGGAIDISDNSSIMFNGLYSQQSTATDKLIGAAYGLKTDTDNSAFKAYVGLWLRINESYIPYIAADYQNYSVGINYNISTNSTLTYRPSTIEISLVYRGMFGSEQHLSKF
jgi:type IX secretion system PorP/SprF family membrane protein